MKWCSSDLMFNITSEVIHCSNVCLRHCSLVNRQTTVDGHKLTIIALPESAFHLAITCISVLSRGISMKLATNFHHVSGNC